MEQEQSRHKNVLQKDHGCFNSETKMRAELLWPMSKRQTGEEVWEMGWNNDPALIGPCEPSGDLF